MFNSESFGGLDGGSASGLTGSSTRPTAVKLANCNPDSTHIFSLIQWALCVGTMSSDKVAFSTLRDLLPTSVRVRPDSHCERD